MTDSRDWLPRLVSLADCDGNPLAYLEAIYQVFRSDFVESKPAYPGKRFALKRHPMSQGKEATFWHLISEGKVEEQRIPDMRRCERIGWPRPMIESLDTKNVRVWKNQRRGVERIVIAIEDFSYVVILDERREFVLLWTAYYVEHHHSRKKLEKEYKAWKARPENS